VKKVWCLYECFHCHRHEEEATTMLAIYSSEAKAERAKREWEAQRASDDDSSYFVKEWKVL
jgi:wyosine [tRNA(Phe)-imidazoG37] synthetase (radical SAM superfamily)